MSDEIDIEEHDVMDNPSIRKIFPDLSIIKKEINQYYEEALNILPDPKLQELTQETNTKSDPSNSNNTIPTLKELSPQIEIKTEVIIPNTNSVTTPTFINTETESKTESLSASFKVSEIIDPSKELRYSYDNIIILGSKPSGTNILQQPNNNKKSISLNKQVPKVELNNVSPFLNKSKRYCKECLILFPKVNALNLHMYNVHGRKRVDLRNFETNITVDKNVRTTKTDVIFNNKLWSSENSKIKLAAGHACFHCQELFPNQSALIEHLYDILNPKPTATGDFIESSTNRKLKNKYDYLIVKHVSVKNSDVSKKIECSKCQLSFNSQEKYEEHNFKNHLVNKTDANRNEGNTQKRKTVKKRKLSDTSNKLTDNDEENLFQEEITEKRRPVFRDSSQNQFLDSSIKSKRYKCKTCAEQFNSSGKLGYHIVSVHKRHKNFIKHNTVKRNISKKDCFNNSNESKQPLMKMLYKCSVCSKYSVTFLYYSRHLKYDHNIEQVPEVNKVAFDSKCKYCSSTMSDHIAYNHHLYSYHYKQLKKHVFPDENQGAEKNTKVFNLGFNFAFKSILYKCKKCNVFFLSTHTAMSHDEVTDNWQCSTCQRMFQHQDKEMHLIQHSFCKTFTIYTLSESDFNRVLYKCAQCAVHYSEDNFLFHYTKCDSQTPNSIYCKICDILINSNDMDFHEINHKDKNIQCSDFIIIESDIIDTRKMKSGVKRVNINKNINNSNKTGGHCQEKSKIAMAFCHTCKCFVNHLLNKVHIEARCGRIVPFICKECGLIVSRSDTHLQLHKKKQIKLQDYIFYDLKSKKRICPPVPDYPSCNMCGVHFLTKKNIRFAHSCQLQKYMTCNICSIKLSEEAYKLHMGFHNYSIQNVDIKSKDTRLQFKLDQSNDISEQNDNVTEHVRKILTNKVEIEKDYTRTNDTDETSDESFEDKSKIAMAFCHTCKSFVPCNPTHKVHLEAKCGHLQTLVCKECGLVLTTKTYATHTELHKKQQMNLQDYVFYELKSKKRICPPIPEYPNCIMCGVQFLRHKAIRAHLCQHQDYLTCNICSTKLTEDAYKLHMSFHSYSKQNVNAGARNTKLEIEPLNDLTHEHPQVSPTLCAEDAIFLYTCKSCLINVYTYDKVVLHCQDHYDSRVIRLNTKQCQLCNFIFDMKDYEYHNELHSNGKYKKEFTTMVDFDPFYFRFSCDFWTKHIFAYVADEHIRKILDTSIYKYECRLKLEEVQSGSSGLTLYRCDKCRLCIEPHSLYMHAENSAARSCIKLRKPTCAYCGLLFVSQTYQKAHEKEHEDTGIDLKSYKIILYNKTEHERFNKIMYDSCNCYILYQCRNCEGVVDKFQREVHKCDINNLIKCLTCGLFFHKADYDLHFIRHEELDQFITKNMIVVRFGKMCDVQKKEWQSTFSSTIYDYTIYKCKNCELCFKSRMCLSGHVCVSDKTKLKCAKCDLHFSRSEMKHHSQFHESDLEFDDININLVTIDITDLRVDPQQHSEDDGDSKKQVEHANNKNYNMKENINDCSERVETIYKCDCGLHFLEESNAQQHSNNCNVRKVSKQSCFKCDLLFTPGELFNHLLKHHCDKKLQYKFDIVMVHKKDKIINVS